MLFQVFDSFAQCFQIFLTKFIHENWASFEGKFEGLIDLDYNFLGMDLAATPNTLLDQFPGGGWPVWGLLLLPVVATAIQFVMTFINNERINVDGSVSSAMSWMYFLVVIAILALIAGVFGAYVFYQKKN